MTPQERWQRVQELAEQAEEYPTGERESFLMGAEADAALRTEALFLVTSLAREASAAAHEEAPAGRRLREEREWIGPYRVTEVLGQGGMGIVYAAEMEKAGIVRPVAVKLIQRQWKEREQAERFAREQRILAQLDHPGITRLFDTGVTDEGEPYLVMERIAGEPLDRYCDGQLLTMEQRIRMVVQACKAVEEAHRNLIVHLDLKPANILVTRSGQVKLLDFGTAKLLEGDGALTTTKQLTPMYASPEQLRGEPVSIACDIYSLGLILYEQLSGAWPFGPKDSMMSVAARAVGSTETQPLVKGITEETARKRGTRTERLREKLRGDLEAIVAKALAARPGERYGNAGLLAQDLENYLAQRPIQARRPTTLYRMGKYVARHRGAVSLTAVLLVGLIVAASYAFWQQRQAALAGRRALATAQFLHWMIQSANPINGGATDRTVRDMIERAKPRLEKGLREYPEVFAPLASNFGDFLVNAGRPEAGLDWLRQSVARARQLNSAPQLAMALAGYVVPLANAGQCPEALAVEKELKALLPRAEGSLRDADRVLVHTALAYPEEACELDSAAALRSMEKAYGYAQKIPNDSLETDYPARLFKGVLAANYVASLRDGQRVEEARRVLSEGLQLIAAEPDAGPVRLALLRLRSTIEAEERDYAASAATLRELLPLATESLPPMEVVRLHSVLAVRLASAGLSEEALAEIQEAAQQTEARRAELGQSAHIPYIDTAVAATLIGEWGICLEHVDKASELAGGQIAAGQKINYDAARGICLVQTGKVAEGAPLVRAILASQKVAENPDRPLGKALRAAERASER